jgi:hypothetical protein
MKLSAEKLQARKEELTVAIASEGNAYKVSKKLGVSPQAIYDRCKVYGIVIERKSPKLLTGEPMDREAKKAWLEGLLATKTVTQIAKELGRSGNAIWDRIRRYGIDYHAPRPHGEPLKLADRKKWFKDLLKEKGSIKAVAEALDISMSAAYERCGVYGIRTHVLLRGEPEEIADKKVWLEGLLKDATVSEVAKKLGRTPNAIWDRIRRYKIQYTAPVKSVPETPEVPTQESAPKIPQEVAPEVQGLN